MHQPLECSLRGLDDPPDRGLAQAGTDKTRLISVQVYLYDVAGKKGVFDEMWANWIGREPAHWPMRSCVQVTFAGNNMIEMLAMAVRPENCSG